jgi:hypothetical protein
VKLLLGTNFLIGPGHNVCFSNGCTFVRFEALTTVALKMTAFFLYVILTPLPWKLVVLMWHTGGSSVFENAI